MLRKHGTLILIFLAGLVLGMAVRHAFCDASVSVVASEPVFDAQTIAESAVTESMLLLARQLPSADAEKCAALAKVMLAKRIKVLVRQDPFAVNPPEEYTEAMLPKKAWEGLFKRWIVVAPQAAWAFVLDNHSETIPLREAALRQWSLIDPVAAVNAAGKDLNYEEQEIILNGCLESDPAYGLKLLKLWDFKDKTNEFYFRQPTILEKLLQKLAEKSPVQALEWCMEFAPEKQISVYLGWSIGDLAGCLAAVNSLSVEDQRSILQDICGEPHVTMECIRMLTSVSEPDQVVENIAFGLTLMLQRDESTVQNFIEEQFANPTDRVVLRALMAFIMMQTNPRKAMDIVMPSLREPLPVFAPPYSGFHNSLPTLFTDPFEHYSNPDFVRVAEVFNAYLVLGPVGGVDQHEIKRLIGEIHLQYVGWLLQANGQALCKTLGSPADWLEPFMKYLKAEDVSYIVEEYRYENAEAIRQDVGKLNSGLLRDTIIEQYISQLMDEGVSASEALARVNELGNHQANMATLYDGWIKSEPLAALEYLANDPHQTIDEWESVIHGGYKDHGGKIQSLSQSLPPGELRDGVVGEIAHQELEKTKDFVSSVYWATEISAKEDRAKKMRIIFEVLQTDRGSASNHDIVEGIRKNIQHSPLDAWEKSRWIEQLESEVLR